MASKQLTADEIYDALLDDDLFDALPLRLAQAYGGRSTLIHWHYADNDASVLAHSGYFSDTQLAVYTRDFASLDPWAAAAVRWQRPNRAMDLETLVPLDCFTRTHFFNDYVREMGDDTARCMGVVVRNGFGQGMIAIQRGKSQREFTARQVAGMDIAAAHLRRVLAVRGKLCGVERRLGRVRQMLDALPQGALLVRSDGRVLEANAAAEAMLLEGRLLHMRSGRIGARQREPQLLAAINHACDSRARTASAVPLDNAGALVTVSPVSDDNGLPSAMLLVSGEPAPGSLSRLRQLYGLTEAEAAVAVQLAAGDSVAQIAEKRRVSAATVRTQIRVISDKMGVCRQAQIVLATARIMGLS